MTACLGGEGIHHDYSMMRFYGADQRPEGFTWHSSTDITRSEEEIRRRWALRSY